MRTFRIVCPILLVLSLPIVATAQSLGSVAKKERERRDKNKKEGVAAREISEEEVFGKDAEKDQPADKTEVTEVDAENEPGEAAFSDSDSAIPGVKSTEPEEDRDKESRERRRSEAEWRSKAAAARERISRAQERVRYFEGLVLGPNEYYVDENGRTVVESAAELQSMTRAAKGELDASEADWKALQLEARRGGVPPGWLR